MQKKEVVKRIEKIGEILEGCLDVTFDYPAGYEPKEAPEAWITGHANAASELITLFERKVICEDIFTAEVEEREGYAFDYVILRKGDSVIKSLMRKGIRDGQRVRVIVEEIDESRT